MAGSPLEIGQLTYTDRDYVFTSIPDYLQGVQYLKTANVDKSSIGDDFVNFSVNRAVTVYVGYDVRNDILPLWLLDFTVTGDEIVTSDAVFRLFAKDFSVGGVVLGGNNSMWGYSMYTVAVK